MVYTLPNLFKLLFCGQNGIFLEVRVYIDEHDENMKNTILSETTRSIDLISGM